MIALDDLTPYVERGWRIFPVYKVRDGRCVCRKGAACDSPGKHPMLHNGVKGATADPVQILAWFNSYPACNWAVATGDASGVWVLDVDQHKTDGVAILNAWLTAQSVVLPQTFTVYTGGGGWHLYFLMEGMIGLRVSVLAGVDVRGNGGYVLLPGSNHASGADYMLHTDAPVAVASRRLLDLVTHAPSVGPRGGAVSASTSTDLSRYLRDGFTPGARDIECYQLACSLWRLHYNDPELVEAAIADCWQATADKGTFPWSQAKRKLVEAHKFITKSREAEHAFLRQHGGAA